MPDIIDPWRLVQLAKLNGIAKQQAGYYNKFDGFVNKQEPEAKVDHRRP
jgi:hypothetical protein